MLRKPKQTPNTPLILAAGLGASLASTFLFIKLADEILEHETLSIDTFLVHKSRELHNPALDKAMLAVTTLGEPWALGLFASILGLRWGLQDRKADLAAAALSLAGGSILNEALKRIFHRSRPSLRLRRAHASGYSFPSGHAMTTLTTYGTFAFLVSRRGYLTHHPTAPLIWPPVLLICLAIGASRVYLEVHYPTDILAGWAAATIWATTCSIARTLMEPEES